MRIFKIDGTRYSMSLGALALQISQWCKDQGLTHNVDYEYWLITAKQEIHIRFTEGNESTGSMLALYWSK